MAIATLRQGGNVFLFDASLTPPPILVGDPASVWRDEDDKTYVQLHTFENPVGSLSDYATIPLEPTPVVRTFELDTPVICRVRFATYFDATASPRISVRMESYVTGQQAFTAAQMPIINKRTFPETWDIPLIPTSIERAQRFLDRVNAGIQENYLRLQAPLLRTSNRTVYIRIFEAALLIGTETLGAAPPCRQSPRDDEFMLGGARQFPPPKSDQFGGRRFGYY